MPAPRPSRHLEVERKFDVDSSAVPPSFEGVAAVARVTARPAQSLDAVYFDTPLHDLAARHITLRRRTGGTDAGWHLKLPAASGARTEVRMPAAEGATEDRVPGELVDMVLAIVRDRPLAPAARISTTRAVRLLCAADDTVLAEFCDDRVTARTIGARSPTDRHWREWELELVNAEAVTGPALLDRLSSRLLDTGAVPAEYGSKLARALGTEPGPRRPGTAVDPMHRAMAAQVDELLAWDREVRVDADDSVHQMRVTVRKIRSLLEAAASTSGVSDRAWIIDELRWLAGLLGAARDAEVLAQRYQHALDGLPPALVRGRSRERLVDAPARRYRDGLRRSLHAMRSPRYFRLLDGLDALIEAAPPADQNSPGAVDAAYRRLRKAADAATRAAAGAGRDEALHRLRKRAKRLRYTAAAADTPQVAERAKVVQTLLGDHQDSVVSRAHLLEEAAAGQAAGEDTFTYGLLYQQEDDLARRCRARLDTALGKLAEVVPEAG